MTENIAEEELVELSDTGKALVAAAVKRIREELQITREQIRIDTRQVIQDERASFLKRIKDAVTFFFSQEPKK